MVRIHLFGPTDVETLSGRASSVLAQPKRTALLAYLAVTGPGRFVRRGPVVALFWPELDEPHARNALSKALHFLRRSLGEDVIVTRGADEIGLARSAWSDAFAFHEALERGDDEGAMALHGRGPLLSGLEIGDAPAFDDWLDARRRETDRLTSEAAGRLAAGAAAAGDAARAIAWARKACAVAPFSEPALHRLMRHLDAAGDRAGAIAAYENFARRLKDELGLEPGPETVALAEALRGRCEQWEGFAVTEPINSRFRALPSGVGAGASSIGLADPAPPAGAADRGSTSASSSPSGLAWVSGRRGSALGAAALAAGFVGLGILGRPTASVPAANLADDRIVVAPLQNRTGDPTLDALGFMVQEWITRGLQETGVLDVVEPVSALLESQGGEGMPAAGSPGELARRFGAGLVVTGGFYRQTDSLVFNTRVVDATDERLLLALAPVRTGSDAPLASLDELRSRTAAGVARLLDPTFAQLSHSTSPPPTLEAYRAYMAGLAPFQRRQYRAAFERFSEAARLDTTFALALVWSCFAAGNMGGTEFPTEYAVRQTDSIIDLLVARRASLAPLDQAATDYFDADRRREPEVVLEAALRGARLSPGSNWSYVAGAILGETNPREGLRLLESVPVEHGWARGWSVLQIGLALNRHRLGDYSAELDGVDRALGISPENALLWALRARALLALGRTVEAEASLDRVVQSAIQDEPAGRLLQVGALEARVHGDSAAAERIMERALKWMESDAPRALLADLEGPERLRGDRMLLASRVEVLEGNLLGHLVELHYLQGDYVEAERVLSDAQHGLAARPYVGHLRGLVAAATGRPGAARAEAARLEEAGHYMLAARIHARLEDRGRALTLLGAARGAGIRPWRDLHRQPEWDFLRRDPAFLPFIDADGSGARGGSAPQAASDPGQSGGRTDQ